MTPARFAYVWQYTVRPDRLAEFLAAYSPGGDWTRLFSRDPAYLETVLFRDADDENRFVTIDYWTSRRDRDAFRQRHSVEFERLDSRCENYTEDEVFLGDFVEVGTGEDRARDRSGK